MGKYTLPSSYDYETAEFIHRYILDEFRHLFDISTIGLSFRVKDVTANKNKNIIYECHEYTVTVETNDRVSDGVLAGYVTFVIVNGFYDLYLKYHGRKWNG